MAQQSQSDLDKVKEILMEPQMSEILNRMARAESRLSSVDLDAIADLKKELNALKSEVRAVVQDSQEVKNVIVGINKKLTSAFNAFVKPAGQS